MSAMDRIFAKLLGEMADLEELVKKCNGKETDLITKHVVIAYRVDGEDRFKHSQTQLVDIKRSYQTELGTVWSGFWLARAGYPKVDLEKYKIITTDRASKAFQTGKEDGPLQLRK